MLASLCLISSGERIRQIVANKHLIPALMMIPLSGLVLEKISFSGKLAVTAIFAADSGCFEKQFIFINR